MPIDIRAKVYCSLGPVISGNISDSYIQGSGLVKTTGQVILSGIYSPAIGQNVQFGYYQEGVLARIPRGLRVLSYFADAFRNETTVELGDVLVYFENRKPPLESPTAKGENPDIPCEVLQQAVIPISAAYVFNECINALGITSTGPTLSNHFSVDRFDLSAGYVSVISDLLVSESQFGYINENEVLVIIPLDELPGTGPVISEADIIDISSIGTGDLPGDAVAVNYSSLRLKKPDEEEDADTQASKNWEYERSIIRNSDVEITEEGSPFPIRFPNYEKRETRNKYDSWNRKVSSKTTIRKSIAVANPSFVENVYNFNADGAWDGTDTQIRIASGRAGIRTMEVEEREERYWKYTTPAVGSDTGCGYQEASEAGDIGAVEREEYRLYQTDMGIAAAMGISSYWYSYTSTVGATTVDAYLYEPSHSIANQLTKKTIVEYESVPIKYSKRTVDGKTVVVESESTKTITTDYVAHIFTKEGQRVYSTMAKGLDNGVQYYDEELETLIRSSSELVIENKREEIYTGKNFGVQLRPSAAERTNAANSRDQPSESVAEIEWVTGSQTSTNVITFDLPYAPDDKISWNVTTGFSCTTSDAAAKANKFGRVQNQLLYGNRYGVNIQVSPRVLPARPFDPFYINATGIMGQYRMNGTNWAFQSDGIVASVDALFWGAVGSL